MTAIGIAMTGSGAAVPPIAFDNHQLSHIVETSDEWIATRTGIRARHIAKGDRAVTDLAAGAARHALQMAELAPEKVDLIVLATSTPDDLFGSASVVQAAIGAKQAVAFDLTAACSGFLFAVVTAAQFIRTGTYQNAVVIGADVLSRWVDWDDRRTCVLFGDGAGAVVLQADDRDRLLGYELRSDGSQNDCLNLPFGGTEKSLTDGVAVSQGTYRPVVMNGQEVYKFAVKKVPEVIEKALFRANLTPEAIDWLLLHQANQRILDAVAKRLRIDGEKVVSNLSKYGNTSAASIPIALDEWVRSGQIQPGQIVASSGFGAGLTWGAAIFEWGR